MLTSASLCLPVFEEALRVCEFVRLRLDLISSIHGCGSKKQKAPPQAGSAYPSTGDDAGVQSTGARRSRGGLGGTRTLRVRLAKV